MASAASAGGAKSSTVSDEERRWVVVGVCLNKVLTPALRDVLANEMPKWHQKLLQPPCEIDKQTFGKHEKVFPPSTLKLNYDSINNNFTAHKSRHAAYDYAVKDPLSLAKLFIKPFMANFTGFDQTMDTSAILSVICEAQPFIASGAAGIAKKVRSDIRNEWAHCNFSNWTKPHFQAALQSMELLIKKTNLTPVEEKRLLDELQGWKKNGLELCFGQAVDPDLLKLIKSEVAELIETVKLWKDDTEHKQGELLKILETVQDSFEQEIQDLKHRQTRTEENFRSLQHEQLALRECCNTTLKDVEKLKIQVAKNSSKTPYVFMAPRRSRWFTGRESELKDLQRVFDSKEKITKEKVVVAAVSGLGGSGKTSLVAEYAQRMKDRYQGGVYWFSGEDDTKLADSVNDVAVRFGTLQDNSFHTTLSKTLERISRVQKPWLVVVDDMDELNLSPGVVKLVSGPWQHDVTASGRIVITTRRKPMVLSDDIPDFEESCCLRLECFGAEEAKNFVFQRTGIVSDEKTSSVAHHLVQVLGRLPLALEQACAYIRYLDCSLSSYLSDYNKQSMKLLNQRKASPVSLYESPERRAVCTTWLLNFEHIRNNKIGTIAIRFLNACAFMNPNEIQQELINVGKPPVKDGAYRDFVSTSKLGSRQVLKLLTDFSLFKETQDSCLGVHRLVQEVIRENLKTEEKTESFVDAVRMLNFAFSKCPSPDDLLTSVVNDCDERSSVRSTDPSFFYKWHKLCLHSHELLKNLKVFLEDSSCGALFLPETARVVYQCAIHVNVNGNIREAKAIAELAYRVLSMGNNEVSEQGLVTIFPHMVPLPEPVRRYIQYSCGAPFAPAKPFNVDNAQPAGDEFEQREALEKMRLEGNKLYKEGHFKESVEIYSYAIDMCKAGTSFDSRLLSNRASAYLKLGENDNALKDAEDYIEQCPECFKGYARKALALNGLGKAQDANCAAALAFYHERKIFRNFLPFKAVRFSRLEKCIVICENLVSLFTSFPPSSPLGNVSIDNKILVLVPGEYRLSAESFHGLRPPTAREEMPVGGCILLGVGNNVSKPSVTLSFLDSFGIFSQSCMAVNISFVFNKGFWRTDPGSIVKVSNCSFTSNVENVGALLSEGKLHVENCSFVNCKATGLCIAGQAEVESSVFSGNEFGLKVFRAGNLVVKNSKLHGNMLGIHIGPFAGTCAVLDCEIYDNKKQGIGVTESIDINLLRNRIFHNDRHGIFLDNSSFADIEENIIFENSMLGICTLSDSWCRISRNEIRHNRCGGVHVVPIATVPEGRQSVVEFNKIFGNGGPGIDETFALPDIPGESIFPNSQDFNDLLKNVFKKRKSAIITGNDLKDNEVAGSQPTSTEVDRVCFFCHKKGKLRKCTRCFTAGYCDEECQENHWGKHKSNCQLLLEKSSVCIKVLPKSCGDGLFCESFLFHQAPGLQPLGPNYAKAPQKGTRFIVKIQACDVIRKSNLGGSLVTVYDRSLTCNGDLDWREHRRIYDLVRQCGLNCALYGWKKLYLWALEENGELRIFLNELLPQQLW